MSSVSSSVSETSLKPASYGGRRKRRGGKSQNQNQNQNQQGGAAGPSPSGMSANFLNTDNAPPSVSTGSGSVKPMTVGGGVKSMGGKRKSSKKSRRSSRKGKKSRKSFLW